MCRETHVLWVIWDAEFDGYIHFFNLTEERSTSGQTRSNQVRLPNSKFSYKNIPKLCSFVSGFQKCHLFLCMTIINAKNCFQKCDITFTNLVVRRVHSQKKTQRYCFDILFTYCLYVLQSHIFRFYTLEIL